MMNDMEISTQVLSIKVPDDHDPTKPLPLCITTKGEPNVWATGDGKRVFGSEEWALKSMELDTQTYKDAQRARIDASRLVRATVVDDYDGWVTTTGDEDDYAQDVAELLEKHGDRLAWAGMPEDMIEGNLPSWAFCCTEDGFDFDLEDAIDSYLADSHHENARDFLVDEKALWAFWEAWLSKQNLKSYFIDYSRIVIIDRERFEAELAAARAAMG